MPSTSLWYARRTLQQPSSVVLDAYASTAPTAPVGDLVAVADASTMASTTPCVSVMATPTRPVTPGGGARAAEVVVLSVALVS